VIEIASTFGRQLFGIRTSWRRIYNETI